MCPKGLLAIRAGVSPRHRPPSLSQSKAQLRPGAETESLASFLLTSHLLTATAATTQHTAPHPPSSGTVSVTQRY